MGRATSAALSWWQILYRYSIFEAADSGWSLIIVSTYFGTFLQVVLKEPGADFGWAVTLAALIIAAISPLLGAAADASGRRQPYLRFFVFGVVLCTGGLAWTSTVPHMPYRFCGLLDSCLAAIVAEHFNQCSTGGWHRE